MLMMQWSGSIRMVEQFPTRVILHVTLNVVERLHVRLLSGRLVISQD